MVTCKKCDEEFSEDLKRCPECGWHKKSGIEVAGIVFAVIDLVGVCLSILYSILICTSIFMLLKLGYTEIEFIEGADFEFLKELFEINGAYFLLITLLLLLPIAYIVPMTIVAIIKLKNGRRIGIFFKIFYLLFINLITGILLLCRKEEK